MQVFSINYTENDEYTYSKICLNYQSHSKIMTISIAIVKILKVSKCFSKFHQVDILKSTDLNVANIHTN